MSGFAASVRQWTDSTKEDNKQIFREVLRISAQAFTTGHPAVPQARSPVDTGLFQGNWRFGHGVVELNAVETLDPSGVPTLAYLTQQIRMALPGAYHYFSNNVPYALKLEWGYSKQAPQGMVRITAMSIDTILPLAVQAVKSRRSA